MHEIYYNPVDEAGYAGAYRIAFGALLRSLIIEKNKNTIAKNEINDYLKRQDAYTLHKRISCTFPRIHYKVAGRDFVWERDLIDLNSLKTYNDGYCYILSIIDILSKFAWVHPLKDKSARSVAQALERILSRNDNRIPVYLQTDRGKEFIGSETQKFLKSKNIKYRVPSNPDVKAAIVKRFNRTLKERMRRYFTYKNTKRYIDILHVLLTACNNAKHSTIKMAPAAVILYLMRARQKKTWIKGIKPL